MVWPAFVLLLCDLLLVRAHFVTPASDDFVVWHALPCFESDCDTRQQAVQLQLDPLAVISSSLSTWKLEVVQEVSVQVLLSTDSMKKHFAFLPFVKDDVAQNELFTHVAFVQDVPDLNVFPNSSSCVWTCVAQPIPNGWLQCTSCGARDRPCNRKRFMRKHLACLSLAIVWSSDGSFHLDEVALHRGMKRSMEGTFDCSYTEGGRGPPADA
eukprot:2643645-Amphidinium_carterae.1